MKRVLRVVGNVFFVVVFVLLAFFTKETAPQISGMFAGATVSFVVSFIAEHFLGKEKTNEIIPMKIKLKVGIWSVVLFFGSVIVFFISLFSGSFAFGFLATLLLGVSTLFFPLFQVFKNFSEDTDA